MGGEGKKGEAACFCSPAFVDVECVWRTEGMSSAPPANAGFVLPVPF